MLCAPALESVDKGRNPGGDVCPAESKRLEEERDVVLIRRRACDCSERDAEEGEGEEPDDDPDNELYHTESIPWGRAPGERPVNRASVRIGPWTRIMRQL